MRLKLSANQEKIIAQQFSDDQVKSAIACQKKLEMYNKAIIEGKDFEPPGLTMEEKINMDRYFVRERLIALMSVMK